MEDGGKLVTEELMFYFLTAGTIHSEVCFPGDRFKRRGLHISFSGDFSLHGSNTYVAMKAIVRSIQSTRQKNLLALRYEKGVKKAFVADERAKELFRYRESNPGLVGTLNESDQC
jgi:hypothetical protein